MACRDIKSVKARFEGVSNRNLDITFTDGSKMDVYSIEGSFQDCASDEYLQSTEPDFDNELEGISNLAEQSCLNEGWDEFNEVAEITMVKVVGGVWFFSGFKRFDSMGEPI